MAVLIAIPSWILGSSITNIMVPMLAKLEHEDKRIYLLGDYNTDLMKLDEDLESVTFFDNLTSNLFVPPYYSIIFSDNPNFEQGISGNLTISLSDHLAQFLIIPDLSTNQKKHGNLFKRDTKNFDRVNFLLDLFYIDRPQVLNVQNNDVNATFCI